MNSMRLLSCNCMDKELQAFTATTENDRAVGVSWEGITCNVGPTSGTRYRD